MLDLPVDHGAGVLGGAVHLTGDPEHRDGALLDCPCRREHDRLDPAGVVERIRCGLPRQVDVLGTASGSGRVAVPRIAQHPLRTRDPGSR
jgi:hypothetical protein